MERSEFTRASKAESLVEHVSRNAPALGHSHGGTMESIREGTYRGHHFVIRTSYHIEVDGVPLEGHLGVATDGQVHYHAIPNLRFVSAVDLVKQLIEAFPEDFQPQTGGHTHREEP